MNKYIITQFNSSLEDTNYFLVKEHDDKGYSIQTTNDLSGDVYTKKGLSSFSYVGEF